ncbi:MAG: hypothetical protein K8I30_10540, partial [Anaerolineae bacterium]|nr:hypothetical protein [Anaerolineae bacterium]
HRLVEQAHGMARSLLENNRDKLEALAQDLLTNEVVGSKRVLEIAGRAVPADELAGVEEPSGD